MDKKLKLFTDKRYLPKERRYIPLLYPFWGYLGEDKWSIEYDRFNEYYSVGNTLFELVAPGEADFFLFPCEWDKNYPEVYEIAELAKSYGKKILIFFNSDSDEDITIENSIIFRTSFYASKRKSNEFALPGWSRDFLKAFCNSNLQLKEKKITPVIGYCGYSNNYTLNYLIKYLLKKIIQPKVIPHQGIYLRGKVINKLVKSKDIKTDFIIRDKSGSTAMKHYSQKRILDYRREYVHNIINADYTLVIRGGGNFSYRLYEVLSCGRIPLFINTDCVLPYDHIIDWKKYLFWIDVKDIDSVATKILEFHNKLSNEDFKNMQLNARRLYEEWISPVGFYSNIYKCLNNH